MGVAAIADYILMARVAASQNQLIPPYPMAGGVGFGVSASFAVLDDMHANENLRVGLTLADATDGGTPEYTVAASQFAGNRIGILSESTESIPATAKRSLASYHERCNLSNRDSSESGKECQSPRKAD